MENEKRKNAKWKMKKIKNRKMENGEKSEKHPKVQAKEITT